MIIKQKNYLFSIIASFTLILLLPSIVFAQKDVMIQGVGRVRNRCLQSASNGTESIKLTNCNRSNIYQHWEIIDKQSWFMFRNNPSGLCLDVGSINTGTPITSYPCYGNVSQLWFYNEKRQLVWKHANGKFCLTSDFNAARNNGGRLPSWAGVFIYPCRNDLLEYQSWEIFYYPN